MEAYNELMAKLQGLQQNSGYSESEALKAENAALQHRMVLVKLDLARTVELLRALKSGGISLDSVEVNPDGTLAMQPPRPTLAAVDSAP